MNRPIAERADVDTVDGLKRRRSLSKIQKIAVTATALFVFSQFTPIDGPENGSQKNEKLCATPDFDDIELVTDLFESAADPFFTSKYEQGQRLEDEHGFSGRFPEKAAIDIRARAAKILGLTVYDYLEVSDLQDNSSFSPDTQPKSQSEDYLDSFNAATDFLSLYGVDLIATDPEYTFAFDGRELTQAELEDGRGTSILRELVRNFGSLPVEFISETGLKKIRFMYSDSKAVGYMDPKNTDTLVFNLKYPLDRFTFNHELFHVLDYAQCGRNVMKDPAFRSLNGNENVYIDDGASQSRTFTLDDVRRYSGSNEFLMRQYRESGDKERLCTHQNLTNRIKRESLSVTDYGLQNPVEDKAEIMGHALQVVNTSQDSSILPSKDTPVIRDKTVFLLTRLYKYNPELVKFMAAVTGRSYSTKGTAKTIDC